jgi:uncharacterized protein
MDIPRYIQETLERRLGQQKVLMLYGSRRTGKTTITENVYEKHQDSSLLLMGEDAQISELLQFR